jgi:predicted nucleic acid-binding protein
MGRLSERLGSISVIGLDTAIFIYHFEKHPSYFPLTQEIFSGIEAGLRKGVASTITLMEIIVKPLALGRQDAARKYEALLVNFHNLDIVDLDRNVIRQAARLRTEYRICPPDALQASVSLLYGADVFITNNGLLKRLQDKLEVIILDDYIDEARMANEHKSPLCREQGTYYSSVTVANYLPGWLCEVPGLYRSRRFGRSGAPFPASYGRAEIAR